MVEAAQFLALHGDDAKLVAGGAAITLLLAHKMIAPSVLVSLGRIPGYNYIRTEADGLHIGALTTLRQVERSPIVRQFSPTLAHTYGVIGNVRVRNQGTVGGNLIEADYASDPPAMLCALDAWVKVASHDQARTIPIRDLFPGFYMTSITSNEIVQELVVPLLPQQARTAYVKYAARSNEARPTVGVAAVADLNPEGHCSDLRVAVGAAVPTPQRLPEIEARARGEKLSDELLRAIASDYADKLEPLDDALESAWYRRELIRVFVRRALEEVRDGRR